METLTPPPPPQPPSTTAVKTPDPESEPPQSNTVTKQLPPPLTTTNGVLKRHKPLHHHHHYHHPPPPLSPVAYKECMKNHAAGMGGHAVDGCGEFMPSPTSSPSYPTSLKCAACGCHRNFHRREPEDSLFPSPTTTQHIIEYQPHHRHHPPPPPPSHPPPPPPPLAGTSPGNSPSPPPISSSYYPSAPHMLLALSTGVSPPPADTHHHISPITNSGNKKRFRTKFTQQQKDKMYEIAERVGWKMQKRDESLIIQFCNDIGVDKNVFKVWMHNNKTTFGNKKDYNNNEINSPHKGIDFIMSRNNHQLHDHNQDHKNSNNNNNNNVEHVHNSQHGLQLHNNIIINDSYSTGGNVIGPKGSSSSS